jgi:hypothetical protein
VQPAQASSVELRPVKENVPTLQAGHTKGTLDTKPLYIASDGSAMDVTPLSSNDEAAISTELAQLNVTDVRELQNLNASDPIVTTLEGMEILDSDVAWKAWLPMTLKVLPGANDNACNEVQLSNALLPMLVTPDGISILVRFDDWKA